jgi:glutathione S-transferase
MRVVARMKQLHSFVDAELADAPYFVGAEFTAADVMMTFTFTTMRHFLDYDLVPYANIAAYLKRIEARPAFQRAMARAGPKVGT